MRLRRMPETFQSTPSVWRETVLQVVGQSTGHHFNPLPPYGGRHQSAQYHLHYKLFQSTPSVWRETHCCWEDSLKILHFNPLPPYGGRLPGAGPFQTPNNAFQSTPSVWRETLSGFHSFQCFTISIHSLRMEGDNCSHRVTLQNVHFNPLPPYGGRPERRCLAMKRFKFQSTPSVWRETFCSSAFRDTLSFQSTPSVWRETDTIIPIYLDGSISIHSLRMEGD